MLSSLLKLVKCLNLKRQRYILSLWHVQKIVKYKKPGSFHSCTSTIVNLFFIQIKLCIDLKYRRGTTHVCSFLTGLKAIFYPPYLRFSCNIAPDVIELQITFWDVKLIQMGFCEDNSYVHNSSVLFSIIFLFLSLLRYFVL